MSNEASKNLSDNVPEMIDLKFFYKAMLQKFNRMEMMLDQRLKRKGSTRVGEHLGSSSLWEPN